MKSCHEETTRAEIHADDGALTAEGKTSSDDHFTEDGRLITSRHQNADGSLLLTTCTYDSVGGLLKTSSGLEGSIPLERVYIYDDEGRLLKIADSRTPDDPTVIQYDDQGRQTVLHTSRAENYRPNVAFGGTPFSAADRPPNLPGGGSAATICDEQDRPIEARVCDAHGEQVSRAVRLYDAQGRVTEEKQIMEHPEAMIPEEIRNEILTKSGGTFKQLRNYLLKMMSGGPSIAYTYDAEGRVTQTRSQSYGDERIAQTTYNEHGDTATNVTTIRRTRGRDKQQAGDEYSEAQYSYQYDDRGNWTEEVVACRWKPDGPFQPSARRERKLTYY